MFILMSIELLWTVAEFPRLMWLICLANDSQHATF